MAPEGGLLTAVVLIHRIVGYPLAFIIAPIALASFAGARHHRWAGQSYLVLMTFLYLTGSALTWTRYDYASWEFGRNLSFNFLGYLLMLMGFRSIWLMQRPSAPRAAALDKALAALLVLTTIAIAALATRRSGPLLGVAVAALALSALELRDWRRGFAVEALYRRHLRYTVASYFYVLTVVSLVHLRQELSSDVRWLWPSVIAVAVIVAASRPESGIARLRRAAPLRWAVRAALAVTLLLGAYVGWELARGVPISPQQEPRRAESDQ